MNTLNLVDIYIIYTYTLCVGTTVKNVVGRTENYDLKSY